MSLRERLTRGSDDLDTPEAALLPLLPYLQPSRGVRCVWEPCPGNHVLSNNLKKHGVEVVETNHDFLSTEMWPEKADAIVTNPPFSKKAKFVEKCMKLGGSWALLLPVTTLGVRACQEHLHDAEIIFLPKRIDFTGKKAPWFAVAWFTWGLHIGKQLNFVEG